MYQWVVIINTADFNRLLYKAYQVKALNRTSARENAMEKHRRMPPDNSISPGSRTYVNMVFGPFRKGV